MLDTDVVETSPDDPEIPGAYRIIVANLATWRERAKRGESALDAMRRLRQVPLWWCRRADGSAGFTFVCPDCGMPTVGSLGPEPVSGWDNPRWVRSGDDKHLSFSPSLGCSRAEDEPGKHHFWARDGWLVRA